jgi:hypothetical protein
MVMAAKTGSAVAVAVTMAMVMVVADNNRNCRGRQQSTKCSIGSGGDSSHGSSNCDSAALTAGRGGSAAEVTTMRAAATATTVVVNIHTPLKVVMWRSTQISVRSTQISES